MSTKFIFLSILIILSYCTYTTFGVCTGELYKFPLDQYPYARCLDGSPGAYYHLINPESRNWIIAFEGGGECVTESQCTSRSKGDLGSSNGYKDTMNMFSFMDCESSSPFKDWNKIYVKYCSGDLFFGQDIERTSRAYNLQFSGYNIARNVIDDLFGKYHLDYADNIILTGFSAGGLGVVTIGDSLLDWLYLKMAPIHTPTQQTIRVLPNGMILKGPKAAIIPIAGYHFETNPIYIQKTNTDPAPVSYIPWKFEPDWKNYLTLWNATIPERCLLQGKWKPYECLIAQGNYETSITPWFVIQSTIDSVVLPLHGGCPTVWTNEKKECSTDDIECPNSVKDYMRIWHNNMTIHIAPVENKHRDAFKMKSYLYPQQYIQTITNYNQFGGNNSIRLDGVFASACLIHTDFGIAKPKINNLNYKQATWNWYNDDTIYQYNDTNPHFHIDRCKNGDVLCGQCK